MMRVFIFHRRFHAGVVATQKKKVGFENVSHSDKVSITLGVVHDALVIATVWWVHMYLQCYNN